MLLAHVFGAFVVLRLFQQAASNNHEATTWDAARCRNTRASCSKLRLAPNGTNFVGHIG